MEKAEKQAKPLQHEHRYPQKNDSPTTNTKASKPINQRLDNVIDIVCGSAAGAAGKLIEYPFDTVKVRLQSQPNHLPPQFTGPFDCFRQTFQREGFAGYYRGVASPIVGAALETASLFLSYNFARGVLAKHWFSATSSDLRKNDSNPEANLPFTALLLCGSFSGIVTSFILTPIELVKCQMQVQMLYPVNHSSSASLYKSLASAPAKNIKPTPSSKAKPPGLFGTIVGIYRKEGLIGFWRGQTGTLFREAGGSAAWFGSYEYVNSFLQKSNNRNTNTIWENMIAGAFAGVLFNFSLFPADTIKSTMQTEGLVNSSKSKNSQNKTTEKNAYQRGFWETGKSIYKANGIRGFYRGCGVTVTRAAPSSAIIFVTYENLKSTVHKLFE